MVLLAVKDDSALWLSILHLGDQVVGSYPCEAVNSFELALLVEKNCKKKQYKISVNCLFMYIYIFINRN